MSSRRIPTKQELLQLQKLYRTDKKIGQALGGVSEQLVAYWRRKKGVGKSIFPKYSFLEIKELWERYGDDEKAGLELQITKQAFYRWRKKYRLLERPTILKLEQLEFKFFDEQRLNRGAGRETPAQTYLQKIASYHLGSRFVRMNESVEIIPDHCVQMTAAGIRVVSDGKEATFHSIEEMFAGGYFQPGRVIYSDSPESAALAVTSSLVEIAPKCNSALEEGLAIPFTIVPTIRLALTGTQQGKQTPFDSACCIWEVLRGALSQAFCIELSGGERLTLEERMGLLAYTRLLTQKHVILEPDQTFLNYVSQYGAARWPVPFSDKNVYFLDDLNVTVARSRSLVRALGRDDFVHDISELQSHSLKRIRVGPVLGGTLEDFRLIANTLRDGEVKSGLELYVIPRSKTVFVEALRRKYVQKIVEAGGFVGNFSAQPSLPPLGGDEFELTTEINHNSSANYLASTTTIALTLVSGKISKRLVEFPPID